MNKPNYQRPVLILGMHRSGTSMVARALNEAGVYMGAIRDHNAEALYAVDLNERLFSASDASWWQPPTQDDLKDNMPLFEQDLSREDLFGAHLKHYSGRLATLKASYSGKWGLKDPRLCYTLPWWVKRFPEAQVVWVLRDEHEVARSLMRRQLKEDEAQSNLTEEAALALVRSYNEAAAVNIRNSGVEHKVVKYSDLVSEDEMLQRKTWFSLYQFIRVRPGQMIGFKRKSDRITKEQAPVKKLDLPTEGPLVSVIVPNYNHAPFLQQRIESILKQSYGSIEVLLMDDKSPDNSREILLHYAESDHRVSHSFNEHNSGSPFAQWKKGAAWAKGKYLWIAESDDSCDLDMLALHVHALESNENAVITYSHSHLVDESGEFLRDFKDDYSFIFGDASRWSNDFTVNGPHEVATTMVFSNTIPNASGALFRKAVFDRVGTPEVTWKLNGDWLFYARLLQEGDVVFHAQPRNKFRFHEHTQRNRAIASYTAFDEILNMYAVFERNNWVPLETLQKARAQVAMWWAANVFSMARTSDVVKNNIRLYYSFTVYRKGLLAYILKNGLIKITGQIFIVLGLKKPVKKLAARLFPKTFFPH
jgi:glycosyltransferase involved in cell wall biosynthesis